MKVKNSSVQESICHYRLAHMYMRNLLKLYVIKSTLHRTANIKSLLEKVFSVFLSNDIFLVSSGVTISLGITPAVYCLDLQESRHAIARTWAIHWDFKRFFSHFNKTKKQQKQQAKLFIWAVEEISYCFRVLVAKAWGFEVKFPAHIEYVRYGHIYL